MDKKIAVVCTEVYEPNQRLLKQIALSVGVSHFEVHSSAEAFNAITNLIAQKFRVLFIGDVVPPLETSVSFSDWLIFTNFQDRVRTEIEKKGIRVIQKGDSFGGILNWFSERVSCGLDPLKKAS